VKKHKIRWQHFPKNSSDAEFFREVVDCSNAVSADIACLDTVEPVNID